MKNRKLTRIIAITLTATVAATSVMPCGTVLGAQNDPVTEEAAETTESVQESEVSESEISEDEIQTETESQTGTAKLAPKKKSIRRLIRKQGQRQKSAWRQKTMLR